MEVVLGEVETTAQPAASGRNARTDHAARRLAAALGPRTGHVVLVGPTACAAAEFLGRMEAALVAYRSGRVSGRTLDAAHVLAALDVGGPHASPAPAALGQLVDEARRMGRPVVLVVTEADAASVEALEALRLLVEGAPDAVEVVRVVLVGGPDLLPTLRTPEARALRSRVTTVIELPTEAIALPLGATSDLASAAARPAAARPRRWPRPRRMVAAGLLGSAVTAVIVPIAVPIGPSPSLGIAKEAPARVATESETLLAPVSEHPPVSGTATPARAVDPEPAVTSTQPPVPQAVVHEPPRATPRLFSIQVGAFRDPTRAAALRADLARRFEWVMVTDVERDGIVWHRVRVEGLPSRAAVTEALGALRGAGHRPIVVRN